MNKIGIGAAALAVAAAGARAQGIPDGIEGVAAEILQEAAGYCAAETDGGALDIRDPGGVTFTDLDGDGGTGADGSPDDVVIDFNNIYCDRAGSLWHGTGGAPIHLILDGETSESWTAHSWEVERMGPDYPAVVLLARHGSACDGAGAAPCVQAIVAEGGRFWTPEAPQEVAERITALEEAERQMGAILDSLRSGGDRTSELIDLRVALDSAETAAAEATDRLAAAERAQARAEARATALGGQVAGLREQLQALEGLADSVAAEDGDVSGAMDDLREELQAALARAEEAEARAASLEAAAGGAAEEADLDAARAAFVAELSDRLAGEGVEAVGDRFAIASGQLFQEGGATLSASGEAALDEVATALRTATDDVGEWTLRVDGHTDDVPVSDDNPFGSNWALSQARALSVVQYLSDEAGIPPDRLAANGYGQYRPLVVPENADARARNRRIELVLMRR
ncbi:OmpA family protein [Wenxinia marina]|uniref:Flagellar motor protein n=1 Tax=Wenxinia marina DSM 24838 TaxID=1123501 RepID=A0A0D0NQ08_9RHOB|nr:OmpA family protein [Wenxinia marina]KIQ70355.1 Flagellar motor protein [Wenxinia marina DSM 24838]GGL53768.1 hypothetical protein GCM10011392_05210 [Wenxinia marina]